MFIFSHLQNFNNIFTHYNKITRFLYAFEIHWVDFYFKPLGTDRTSFCYSFNSKFMLATAIINNKSLYCVK